MSAFLTTMAGKITFARGPSDMPATLLESPAHFLLLAAFESSLTYVP